MSETARLILKVETSGYADQLALLQRLKAMGLEVQESTSRAAKKSAGEQQNAHVMVYRSHQQMLARQKQADEAAARERKQLEEAMWRGREQRERELTSVAAAQSAARLATWRKETAEAKALAKQEADAAKQAAREARTGAVATGAGGLNVGAVNLAATLSVARQVYGALQQVYGVMANITNEAAKWEKFDRALTDIEGSSSIAKRSLDDLYELAKRPGIGLEQANQVYLQFRALGIEGEKAKRMIADFSNTVALSGGGATEFERSNYQLIQMISKGKVLEEDLRIMRNSMPRLTVLMREAFGATTAKDLRDRGIDANKFVEGILTQMEKLPTATQTLESRSENAATAWSRFKAALVDTNAVGGAIDFITSKLEGLTKILEGGAAQQRREQAKGAIYTDEDKSLSGVFSGQQHIRDEAYIRAMQQVSLYMSTTNELTGYAADAARQEAMAEATKKTPEELEEERKKREQAKREAEQAAREAERRLRASPGAKAGAQMLERGKQLMAQMDAVRASQEQADLDAAQAEGEKLLAVQEKLDELRKKDVDDANEASKKKVEDRKKALEELAKAERGEYANRFAEIDAWERDLTTRLQTNESERTRIVATATRQRRELYATAYAGVLDNTSGFFGSMAALAKQRDEDDTRSYAKWVAIQQSLAIASASMNIYVAMSRALNSGITTLDGLVQMGVVAAEGGKILSAITSMNAAKVGKGAFARGGELGYGEWGIAGEAGAEIIEGPARITSTRDTARAMSGKATTQVTVHNYAGADVAVQEREDGSLEIILNKAAELAENRMVAGVLQGSGKLGRAMQSAYSLKRKGF